MKTFFYPLLSFLILTSTVANAVPLVDFSITAGQWQPEYSGKIGQNNNTATLDDLGFDDDEHNVITAVLKHPVPVIPNIRLQHTTMETEASGTATFTIRGTNYSASETVDTDLDLSHTDVTLFYSPLDNWVKFDLGLTGRYFGGEASFFGNTTNRTEEAQFDDWLPLVYAGARFELPLSGLYIDATINTLSYDDNSLTDYTAAIGYGSNGLAVDLLVELGYRSFSLEVDDIDGFEGNVDIEGLYLSLGLRF